METLSILGIALGFATLSGINLYLTTFVGSLAIHLNLLDLAEQYDNLAILDNPWIIGISGTLFTIEFFADKIPWLDSIWDAIHTFIRPIGGAVLGLTALGELDPTLSIVACLLFGSTTLATHAAKAGTRLLINTSPEPFTNSIASVSEDALVLGGLGIMAHAPIIAFFLFLTIITTIIAILFFWFMQKSKRSIRKQKN